MNKTLSAFSCILLLNLWHGVIEGMRPATSMAPFFMENTMESVQFKQMRKWVEKFDSTIKATDPRWNHMVRILHEEGTELIFECAFLLKYNGWIIVITEHHGSHFYPEDDLYAYMQYKRVEVEEIDEERIQDQIT